MSKIALTGNASGTGTLTIAAPNTNSDRTINLPDSAGTVILEPSSGELVINEGSADVDFRVESDGNANMLFVDAGNNNVYIGKSASNTSAVGNEFLSYGRHITTVDATTCSVINRTSSDGTILLFEKDGSAQGNIGCEGGKLKLTSSGTNLVFAVGTTTYLNMDNLRLYPQTDDSYDLGISSHRFDDIFATNTSIQTSDASNPSALNADCISCAIMPVCVLALSPFFSTASFHLYVLNNVDNFFATLSSLAVALAMSCFSFLSDV